MGTRFKRRRLHRLSRVPRLQRLKQARQSPLVDLYTMHTPSSAPEDGTWSHATPSKQVLLRLLSCASLQPGWHRNATARAQRP